MKNLYVFLILLFPATLFAQKVGDTVVVIAEKRAELKSGDDVVGSISRGNLLHINEANSEAFRVTFNGTIGWINRSDVIHIDKAVNFFTAALSRNPTAIDFSSRGIGYYHKGDIDKALSDLNEAIQFDPDWETAYITRGIVWQKKGQYDKAISDYSGAIRLDPKYARSYNNRAWIRATCPDAHYRNGKQAVEDATKACELTDWKRWVNVATLAEAYAESGDFEAAIKWQNKAIELDTKDSWKEKHERLELYKSGKPYREKSVK